MSRSKRRPVSTDYSRSGTWYFKKQANKKVRKFKYVIADGNAYKKVYCSYDIRDYIWKPNKYEPDDLEWYIKLSRK